MVKNNFTEFLVVKLWALFHNILVVPSHKCNSNKVYYSRQTFIPTTTTCFHYFTIIILIINNSCFNTIL